MHIEDDLRCRGQTKAKKKPWRGLACFWLSRTFPEGFLPCSAISKFHQISSLYDISIELLELLTICEEAGFWFDARVSCQTVQQQQQNHLPPNVNWKKGTHWRAITETAPNPGKEVFNSLIPQEFERIFKKTPLDVSDIPLSHGAHGATC